MLNGVDARIGGPLNGDVAPKGGIATSRALAAHHGGGIVTMSVTVRRSAAQICGLAGSGGPAQARGRLS